MANLHGIPERPNMVTSTCPQADDLRSFHLGMLDERRE
ncbi:MAG: hypothetical protein ACI93T_000482, partial [Porticoccaceae bacterium]